MSRSDFPVTSKPSARLARAVQVEQERPAGVRAAGNPQRALPDGAVVPAARLVAFYEN